MITIISGTNRPRSNARVISTIYASLLDKRDMPNQILDLLDLPPDFVFSALYHNAGKNEQYNELNKLIETTDKFVFIVPEYNGSFPGVLKAFIDGLSYPGSFKNKKAALVGISTGSQGGALALSHLTDVLHYMGMHVLAAKPRLNYISKSLHNGELTNTLYESLLLEQIESFINF
ncbi:NADPH-dependent FMN reductase [Adhaeribacter arboris]|uniref:NADPH-dependent FMN reductase n=1 Tax=Adhaeribacter arboris TaxID=2072846 RepID=A0A2T2YNQ5_9BACT|nr:NAD(P)H-dependent oxidoreductase [Adhaeribacter arboris]PSR57128.1 NADPH-dependent FMN reductase [Adhaeribacter arboris]